MENEFLKAMSFRHACKVFDESQTINEEVFEQILEMGRLSPSSFGMEPWKFVVVQNSALREKIKAFSWGAQGQLPTASHFVMILARKKSQMRYDSPYIAHMLDDIKQLGPEMRMRYLGFYEQFQKEDFKILQSEQAMFDWACKQCYIALSNMMTGAASMGIDSCPIEGFDLAKSEQFLKSELGIDTDAFGVAVMVAFGYRKNAQPDKVRQPLSEVVVNYN